jgi:hypothetical protein
MNTVEVGTMAEPGTEAVPDHIPYKITSTEKTSSLAPGGNGFQEVWRVTYEGPNGTHSFVEVPVAEFTPQRVDELIAEEVENISGVHELGPEPHPENLAE